MFAKSFVLWTLLLQQAHQTLISTQIKSFGNNITYFDFAADRIITTYQSSSIWNLQLLDQNNVTQDETSTMQITQPQINQASSTSDLVYIYISEGKQIRIRQNSFLQIIQRNISQSFPIQKLFFKFRPNYFYSYHDTNKDQWCIKMKDLDKSLRFSKTIQFKDSNNTLRDFMAGQQFVYSVVHNSQNGILLYRHQRSNVHKFTLYNNLTFPNTTQTAKVSVSLNDKSFCVYTEEMLIYWYLTESTEISNVHNMEIEFRISDMVLCDDYALIVLQKSLFQNCELRLYKNDQNLTYITKIKLSCSQFTKLFCDSVGSFKLYTLNRLYSIYYSNEGTVANNSTVNNTDDTKQETNTTDDTTEETNITDDTTEETNITDDTTEETNTTDDTTEETNITDDTTEETNTTDDTTEETNTTEDTTEETNITNNVAQQTFEQTAQEDPPIDQMTEAATQFFKNQQVTQSMQTTASIIPIASTVGKNLLKFVNVGIDMFWMYNFHETNYTRFLTVLTDQLDVMAELRMKPNFLSIFDSVKASAVNSFNESNQNYRNLGNFHYKVPHDVYFLKTSFDIYTTNLLLNLFTFGIMVIIRRISGLLRKKLGIFNLIYDYCLINTRWWMLLICLVEGNLSYLTFYACLQIQVPFFSTFTDKLNICLTVVLFLALIFQSLVFYPMLYALESKSFSENILDVQNFNLKGFLLVMTMNSISNFGRSVFHGLFINHNMIQLIGLTSTNLAIVLICIIVRKEFRNAILFLVTLLVYLIATCFDLLLILQLTDSRRYQYEIPITIASLSFIAGSFLKTFLIIACDLIEFVKDLCESSQAIDAADLQNSNDVCQLTKQHDPCELVKQHDPCEPIKQHQTFNKGMAVKTDKKAKMKKKNFENSETLMIRLTKEKQMNQDQEILKKIKPKRYLAQPKKQ